MANLCGFVLALRSLLPRPDGAPTYVHVGDSVFFARELDSDWDNRSMLKNVYTSFVSMPK